MKYSRKRNAIIYAVFILINLSLILFGLFVQQLITVICKILKWNEMGQLYIILLMLFCAVFVMIISFRELLKLLTFMPISKGILNDSERENMYKIMQKIKNKQPLTEEEKIEFRYYEENSILPKGFVDIHTKKGMGFWSRVQWIVALGTIIVLLDSIKSSKQNVQS